MITLKLRRSFLAWELDNDAKILQKELETTNRFREGGAQF